MIKPSCLLYLGDSKTGLPNLFTGTGTFTGEKLLRETFTGENILRATYIFIKIQLKIIATLYYKISAHFGQYFGNLSRKEEDQKKKKLKKGLRHKSVLISAGITGICPQKYVKTKKTKKSSSPQIRTDFRKTKQKKIVILTVFLFATKWYAFP